ncbi:hypothetical protein K432DRAFT_446630 [Lepidopterella palustris CBS 459.81]|uniref:Uncharacterized protein n=1 Tax=Lepidopterella palustris CBS 459.81 TaxID=1314670 RepID=A0A8E2JAL2_9PEZI|nr:hypothetical protein K432DRAFT_446630 [Lepidopterella palustris CBS 459.81]
MAETGSSADFEMTIAPRDYQDITSPIRMRVGITIKRAKGIIRSDIAHRVSHLPGWVNRLPDLNLVWISDFFQTGRHLVGFVRDAKNPNTWVYAAAASTFWYGEDLLDRDMIGVPMDKDEDSEKHRSWYDGAVLFLERADLNKPKFSWMSRGEITNTGTLLVGQELDGIGERQEQVSSPEEQNDSDSVQADSAFGDEQLNPEWGESQFDADSERTSSAPSEGPGSTDPEIWK